MTEADDLTRVKETPKPIAIYTPAEMARLLAHAPEDTLPFLAIGAFAGLRHAEILRLDWSEVDLAGGLIEVKATKAKTASRRLVPIAANLQQWLAPRHQELGRVVPVDQMSERLAGLAKRPGVDLTWKRNALRHSFISYRVMPSCCRCHSTAFSMARLSMACRSISATCAAWAARRPAQS